MKFKLRDYQEKAIRKIDESLKQEQNVLLQAITGAGKTVIFCSLINKYYHESDIRILVLVHKQEVVEQIHSTLFKASDIQPHDVGICCASLGFKQINKRIVIASPQTFINHLDAFGYAQLIIVDESHTINPVEGRYKTIINYLRMQRPTCRLFGCTSTPVRLGFGLIYGRQNADPDKVLFDRVHHKITYEELKTHGHLVPLKGVVAANVNIEEDLKTVNTSGDFVLDQLGAVMGNERHLETAKQAIDEYCQDYTCICVFCCTIEHAEKMQVIIGDDATICHSKLTQKEREANMWAWKSGHKRIMCSVNILIEGFDHPPLDCLVFARPTLSSALFLQAVGRVLRIHPGKTHGMVVDLTDNTTRFGTDLDQIKFTVPKKVTEKIENSMFKECPACGIEVHKSLRQCLDCGYEWPETECKYAETLPEMKSVVFEKEPPVWKDIVHFDGYIHENKKTGKQLGCVELSYQETEYKTGLARLWLCFADFYSGYAVDKAAKMWKKISDAPFPSDVNEFVEADMLYPSRMLLDLNGQYPEIKDIESLPF